VDTGKSGTVMVTIKTATPDIPPTPTVTGVTVGGGSESKGVLPRITRGETRSRGGFRAKTGFPSPSPHDGA
jgi:hypothetical protein